MKLIEVKSAYELNLNTFYRWLRENKMIVKEITGYVVGPNALEGMETLTDRRLTENGEIWISTQVGIDSKKIPQLLERYEASGLPRLYSNQRQRGERKRTSSRELEKRIGILENQVSILTNQLAAYIKQNSQEPI